MTPTGKMFKIPNYKLIASSLKKKKTVLLGMSCRSV